MKPVLARIAPLLLLVAFAAGTGQAVAQGRGERRSHDRRDDHRELSDAVRRVERQTGGQVLSAERVPFDGRDVNRVKVVDANGRVRVYMDDPQGRNDGRGNVRPPQRTRDDDGDSD